MRYFITNDLERNRATLTAVHNPVAIASIFYEG